MTGHTLAWALGVALMALPQTAAACAQMSETVWLCDRGTAWEAADWDPYGDGSTLLLDDFVLDFDHDYPGSEIADATTTLQEQMITYAAYRQAETESTPEILREEELETPYVRAIVRHQRDIWEDVPFLQTVMLVQVGRERVMLWLSAPDETPPENMDTAATEIISLLRDSCADVVSCAEDYVPQRAVDKERG